jgi:hypothetical protein
VRDSRGRVRVDLVESLVLEQRVRERVEPAAVLPQKTSHVEVCSVNDAADLGVDERDTIWRARSVSCWMSDSAPVVNSAKTTSSAASPA